MTIETVFDLLWQDYIKLNPSTKKIHDLFLEKESKIYNDHVAFRSFEGEYGVGFLAKFFTDLGYKKQGEYNFDVKKLYACHYEPPNDELPKVFISELKTSEFSSDLQNIVNDSLEHITDEQKKADDFFVKGRMWPAKYKTYEQLAKESEYAAWLYAFGYRANHFTVNVNRLESFKDLEEVNKFIESNGFELNDSGGKIKGKEEDKLIQSSTKAKKIMVEFEDGKFEIPACYYEFAKRYPLDNGKLYQGFVAANADKIFESTNRY